ncbi:mRNA decay activator protein ZFP36L2-A-like [Spea bombifrons]|uniref:mRNA decay activator protein ZFP36L2-A-like n=1 Tax=Spea bombifrons TaxID=233779 RepID=UPI002349CF50|nr:mRNA decay activator protein ZFP36L2-A-like [Spea bombifrons]
MPSSLLSPFPELDTNFSKDFLSLKLNPSGNQDPSFSSCPLNLKKKSYEQLVDFSTWPTENLNMEMPATNLLRHIPFQAERSVSLIEDGRKPLEVSRQQSTRYKTELCRTFHESGSCKYGSKCQFAHGMGELRGLNRHPKYKTELCRTYHTIGFCPYGSRCHFIHNVEEQRFCGRTRAQCPHLLRQSVSCSGIPSSSSSSNSLFSTSLSSLSPFSPSSPTSPNFSPSNSLGGIMPSSPALTLSMSSLFRALSPPSEEPAVGEVPLNLPSSPTIKPEAGKTRDCLSDGGSTETVQCNAQEARRLPIFSKLSF